MAITGMTGAVYVSDVSTPSVQIGDTTCSQCAEDPKRYLISNPLYRYVDPTKPVLVTVNDAPLNEGYIIEYAGGYIEFAEELAPGAVVNVTVYYLTLIQAGGFFNWSIDTETDEAEVTTYASGGWKEFLRTLKGWSGSAEAFWGNEQFINSLGQTVVVKLFVNKGVSQDCFEGFAVITGDGIETPVDGVVEESIDFTGTGPLYIRMEE